MEDEQILWNVLVPMFCNFWSERTTRGHRSVRSPTNLGLMFFYVDGQNSQEKSLGSRRNRSRCKKQCGSPRRPYNGSNCDVWFSVRKSMDFFKKKKIIRGEKLDV